MNDDIRTENIIDALYTAITDSISEDVCHDCLVVQAIRDFVKQSMTTTTRSYGTAGDRDTKLQIPLHERYSK